MNEIKTRIGLGIISGITAGLIVTALHLLLVPRCF